MLKRIWAVIPKEVVRAIDAGRARAGLVIPPDFDSSVESDTAQVLFLVDGSDFKPGMPADATFLPASGDPSEQR